MFDRVELLDAFDGQKRSSQAFDPGTRRIEKLPTSTTSGSHAADSMVVVPLARVAAIITLAGPCHGTSKCAPPEKTIGTF